LFLLNSSSWECFGRFLQEFNAKWIKKKRERGRKEGRANDMKSKYENKYMCRERNWEGVSGVESITKRKIQDIT
jgi:hypothetical protein